MQSQRAMSLQKLATENLSDEHHRGAGAQHAAGRDDAADAVEQRQAIVQAIIRRRAGQAGEPAAPVQDAPMADAGGLRQAGGARRVDQQRAIVDGDRGAVRSRVSGLPSIRSRISSSADVAVVDIELGVAAMDPDLRHAVQIGRGGLEHVGEIRGEDDMIGFRDVDAMRQRLPDQLGIDQRDDAADLADAEPGGDVIRPVRHQQANGIAGS